MTGRGTIDLTEILVHVHHETPKAVLVSTDANERNAVWLPLSAIEFQRRRTNRLIADVTLPENLAIEKGLA